jgi:hypothetical protein
MTWRHSGCKSLLTRPLTPLEEVSDWFHPYVKEAQAQRLAVREAMGLPLLPKVPGLPPSGEEKYDKQQPGGIMAAVNISEESDGGKNIMDVLPELIKIAKAGNIVKQMADYLVSKGWTEEDWVHQSTRYLYRVNSSVILAVRNTIRDIERGNIQTGNDFEDIGAQFVSAMKTRKKHGYP